VERKRKAASRTKRKTSSRTELEGTVCERSRSQAVGRIEGRGRKEEEVVGKVPKVDKRKEVGRN
jgi:hypothetical protein